MKKLIFEASKGYFGECGYVRMGFWRWLFMLIWGWLEADPFVLRKRWITRTK